MAIIHADSSNFHELIQDGFAVVDFYGTTCVPCKQFARILEDVDAELPYINFVKINTTENRDIAREFKIMGVPTIHFYKDGQLVKKNVGVMQAEELKEAISVLLYM